MGTMSEKLSPCECGAVPDVLMWRGGHWVYCVKCGTGMDQRPTEAEAIQAWNTRAEARDEQA